MERKRDPADCGEGQLPRRDTLEIPPLSGDDDDHRHDAERESKAPDGDCDGIGSRELDEGASERDPEEGDSQDPVRGDARGRIRGHEGI
jgi:hypothetical protein